MCGFVWLLDLFGTRHHYLLIRLEHRTGNIFLKREKVTIRWYDKGWRIRISDFVYQTRWNPMPYDYRLLWLDIVVTCVRIQYSHRFKHTRIYLFKYTNKYKNPYLCGSVWLLDLKQGTLYVFPYMFTFIMQLNSNERKLWKLTLF